MGEFEADIRKERQLEGVAKANAAGVHKGRQHSVDVEGLKALKVSGKRPAEITKKLGMGRASVYRALVA